MFYFDKSIKKVYNGYNICHLFNEYDFFENLVEMIDDLENENIKFYITINAD